MLTTPSPALCALPRPKTRRTLAPCTPRKSRMLNLLPAQLCLQPSFAGASLPPPPPPAPKEKTKLSEPRKKNAWSPKPSELPLLNALTFAKEKATIDPQAGFRVQLSADPFLDPGVRGLQGSLNPKKRIRAYSGSYYYGFLAHFEIRAGRRVQSSNRRKTSSSTARLSWQPHNIGGGIPTHAIPLLALYKYTIITPKPYSNH